MTEAKTNEWFARAGPRAERYREIVSSYQHLSAFGTGAPPALPARMSILVPTLNEEDYIEDACRSLALQTARQAHPESVEIVLVDSGSTDRTPERARPYVDRIVSAPRGKLL